MVGALGWEAEVPGSIPGARAGSVFPTKRVKSEELGGGRGGLGVVSGWSVGGPGIVLGRFLGHLGTTLASLWHHYGINLG